MGFLDTLPDASGKQSAPTPAPKATENTGGKFLSSLPDVGPIAPSRIPQTQEKPLGPLLSKLPDAKLQQKVIAPPAPTPPPTAGENVSNFFKSIPDTFSKVANAIGTKVKTDLKNDLGLAGEILTPPEPTKTFEQQTFSEKASGLIKNLAPTVVSFMGGNPADVKDFLTNPEYSPFIGKNKLGKAADFLKETPSAIGKVAGEVAKAPLRVVATAVEPWIDFATGSDLSHAEPFDFKVGPLNIGKVPTLFQSYNEGIKSGLSPLESGLVSGAGTAMDIVVSAGMADYFLGKQAVKVNSGEFVPTVGEDGKTTMKFGETQNWSKPDMSKATYWKVGEGKLLEVVPTDSGTLKITGYNMENSAFGNLLSNITEGVKNFGFTSQVEIPPSTELSIPDTVKAGLGGGPASGVIPSTPEEFANNPGNFQLYRGESGDNQGFNYTADKSFAETFGKVDSPIQLPPDAKVKIVPKPEALDFGNDLGAKDSGKVGDFYQEYFDQGYDAVVHPDPYMPDKMQIVVNPNKLSTFKPTAAPAAAPISEVGPVDAAIAGKIATNIQHYQTHGGYSGVGKPNQDPALRDLEAVAETPTAKQITQQKIEKAVTSGEIKPDADGKITLYRVGDPGPLNNLMSATYDKTFAQSFDRTGNAPIHEFKVDPGQISYFIGSAEKEVLVNKALLNATKTPVPTEMPVQTGSEKSMQNDSESVQIPKEKPQAIEPLAKEARNFKTAEEFVDHYIKNQNEIPASPEYQQFLARQTDFVKRENENWAKIKTIQEKYKGVNKENATPKQIKEEKIDRKEYEKLYAERNSILSKKTLDKIPEGIIKTHIGEKALREQLAETWEKANAVAKETAPAKTGPDLNKLAQEAMSDFKDNGVGPKEPSVNTEELQQQMQAGFINPGQMAEDAAKAVTDAQKFIEKSNKISEFSGDIDKDLNILRTSTKADNIIAKEYLKNVKISPEDAEAIYHYAEDKTSPISEEQKAIFEKYIKPLQEERDRLFGEVKNEGVPLNREDYTPRFVAGKGGVFETIQKGSKSIREGGLLRKTTGSFKKRVMRSLVDESGKRQVISIKKGMVTAYDNKIAKDLGRLKIKKYQDLLDKEVAPIQNKLSNLQKELDTLASIKMRSPISQARLENLHEKIVEMHVENALSALLDKEKAGFTPREKTTMRVTLKEISTLEKVKKSEGVALTQKRIATLQKKIVELVNQIGAVESQYPDETNAKVFVDKSGKPWKIVDATTKEIEKHTNLTYHKNILLNELISYTRLKQVARATEFLNKVKESPQFSEFAIKTGEGDIPPGWKPTTLPQFIGYQFEPKIADTLDNFASKMKKGEVLKPLSALNTFLRTSIFFNPFIHIPNIVNHAVVARGTYRLALPKSYARLAKSAKMAFDDLATLSPRYQQMLESGVNLMYGDTTSQLTDLMVKKMLGEVKKTPEISDHIAKVMGIPAKVLQTVWGKQGISSKITWFTNDFFTLQAIHERELEGMSTEEAIADVGKHIPNYQIPARILNQRVISQVMQNPNLTMFGAYHYGALKSYGEMAKSLITGDGGSRPMQYSAKSGKRNYGEYYDKESFKNRAKAADIIAMAAIIGFFLYPLADKFLQAVSGNKKMQLRRAGSTTIPYNTWKLLTGKEDFSTYIQSMVTPAIGTKAAAQLFTNTDFYTRQRLINQGSELKDLLGLAEKSIAPVNQVQQLYDGVKTPSDVLLGLFGISVPKTTPSEVNIYNLLYDRRPVIINEVKDLWDTGKQDQANALMADFNKRLLENTIDAFKENGFKIQDEAALREYLINQGLRGKFITPPTEKQMQNYDANQNKTNLQKILK